MDRRLEKRNPLRRFLPLAVLAMAVFAAGFMALRGFGGGERLNVEAGRLTVATVSEGVFEEYIPVVGTVEPIRTIFLDAVEGGRVESVFVREGALVEEGEPLLRLASNGLQLNLLNADIQRMEQINRLRSTVAQLGQSNLQLRQQLTEAEYRVEHLAREHARRQEMYEKGFASAQEYEEVADDYRFWRRRRDLARDALHTDSIRLAQQVAEMEAGVGRMESYHGVINGILDGLTVRAPVSGQLTAFDAQVGELHTAGSRFGQIDILDGYRAEAQLDEHYVTRVAVGQSAEFQYDGQTFRMEVAKVHPEVRDGRFRVELAFSDDPPEGLRRGQTLRVRLRIGDRTSALLLPRGGFYQTTGGAWVFVVDPSGTRAERREVRLGRQNPEFFEVLDGLRPGDRVIVSSYDGYSGIEELRLR